MREEKEKEKEKREGGGADGCADQALFIRLGYCGDVECLRKEGKEGAKPKSRRSRGRDKRGNFFVIRNRCLC